MLVIWVGVHLHSMRGAHNRPDPGWCSKPGALSLHSVLFWEAGSRSPLRGLSDADSHNAGWTMGFPTLFTICLFLPYYWQIAKFYRFLRTKQIIGIWVFRLARWLTQSLLLRLVAGIRFNSIFLYWVISHSANFTWDEITGISITFLKRLVLNRRWHKELNISKCQSTMPLTIVCKVQFEFKSF